MPSSIKFIPRTSTIFIILALLALDRSGWLQSKVITYSLTILLIINWRSFPLVYHLQVYGVAAMTRIRLFRFGPESLKVFSVAQNPFDRIVTKKNGFVSLDAGDCWLHMSNSSYAKALDEARFRWMIEVVGPALQEGIWSPLASTSFVFLKEIPLLATYEIDVNIVSWDEKWMYYIAKFTTSPPLNSPKGTPRIINCLALQKACFKLGRLTIPPSRVLSFSGLGADRKNYLRMEELRKSKRALAWLKFASASEANKRKEERFNDTTKEKLELMVGEEDYWERDGMEAYEARRIERLETVEGFRDVRHWTDL